MIHNGASLRVETCDDVLTRILKFVFSLSALMHGPFMMDILSRVEAEFLMGPLATAIVFYCKPIGKVWHRECISCITALLTS